MNGACTSPVFVKTRQFHVRWRYHLASAHELGTDKTCLIIEQDSNKSLRLMQEHYKRRHNQYVRLDAAFLISYKNEIKKPHLFRSVAKLSAVRDFNNLLPLRKGLYKVLNESQNTLLTIRNKLENTVAMHRATLTSTSMHYCNDEHKRDGGMH